MVNKLPSAVRSLHLNTAQCLDDVANKAALLAWDGLLRENHSTAYDPHCFPTLAKTIHRILQRRIDTCPLCEDPRQCDPWARTGGVPLHSTVSTVSCMGHRARVEKETSDSLEQLRRELENEATLFLTGGHQPRATPSPLLTEMVHRAMENTVSYLKENVACSRCENVRNVRIQKEIKASKGGAMLKAELGQELVLEVLNDIGVLAEITQVVSDKGISLRAVSSWVKGADGLIHLVTDDNLRAGDALRKKKFKVREEKVILAELPNKPGMLKRLTERLEAEQIDIHHLYATADGIDKCLVVFSSSDNDRAMVEINRA